MIRVILESPYSSDIERNIKYARDCVKDSLNRGEAPLASHLLYTQPGILNDDKIEERKKGIEAGLEWLSVAEKHIFYIDFGMTLGMNYALELSKKNKIPIEFRKLYGNIKRQPK
jgi:hypothetical protein